MSAIEMQIQLNELLAERALATMDGFAIDASYTADLLEAITWTHRAYMLAVISEIAVLRADLSEPLHG